jgi:single-strand DNA-binding protein
MSTTTGVNKVILFGEITSEPVFKDANSIVQGCSFTVVTHEMVRRGREKLPHIETHQINASKMLVDAILDKLQIGCKIYVEGRIETSSHVDYQGVRRYDTRINATRIEFPGLAIAG